MQAVLSSAEGISVVSVQSKRGDHVSFLMRSHVWHESESTREHGRDE